MSDTTTTIQTVNVVEQSTQMKKTYRAVVGSTKDAYDLFLKMQVGDEVIIQTKDEQLAKMIYNSGGIQQWFKRRDMLANRKMLKQDVFKFTRIK